MSISIIKCMIVLGNLRISWKSSIHSCSNPKHFGDEMAKVGRIDTSQLSIGHLIHTLESFMWLFYFLVFDMSLKSYAMKFFIKFWVEVNTSPVKPKFSQLELSSSIKVYKSTCDSTWTELYMPNSSLTPFSLKMLDSAC